MMHVVALQGLEEEQKSDGKLSFKPSLTEASLAMPKHDKLFGTHPAGTGGRVRGQTTVSLAETI